MLSPKFIRENPELVEKNLKRRVSSMDLSSFQELEQKRLAVLQDIEKMKSERNAVSKEIGILKSKGEDASDIMVRMKSFSDEIKEKDREMAVIEEQVRDFCLSLPNILADDVPDGTDESANREVKKWGEIPSFDFEIKDHADIGLALDIFDFERAAKISGARFAILKGAGSRLERALAAFMLDENTKAGYQEVTPPYLVNATAMTGTGQLPKFEEDLFKLAGDLKYYLIPTAEVPVTNIYRDEILKAEQLPVNMCAYSACFRSEAGSAGRDTKGIIRQHQFSKVEVVKICRPQDSEAEHEKLLADAENILVKLGLPYRVVVLSSGDTGFGARKCYDIEVYLPSIQGYKEISSCSNYWDFQAVRSGIRYKDEESGKNITCHTLNGSALAVGRSIVAILENFQQADGSVRIPEVLHPYMGCDSITPP